MQCAVCSAWMKAAGVDIQDGDGRRSVEGGVTSVTLRNGVCGAAGVAAFSWLTQ